MNVQLNKHTRNSNEQANKQDIEKTGLFLKKLTTNEQRNKRTNPNKTSCLACSAGFKGLTATVRLVGPPFCLQRGPKGVDTYTATVRNIHKQTQTNTEGERSNEFLNIPMCDYLFPKYVNDNSSDPECSGSDLRFGI